MYISDTSTVGQQVYYTICRRCGEYKEDCLCFFDESSKIEIVAALKLKLLIYKCLKIKKKIINVVHFIRKTPTSISGMRGLALLKREDKI